MPKEPVNINGFPLLNSARNLVPGTYGLDLEPSLGEKVYFRENPGAPEFGGLDSCFGS